jgi:hypothetical protein
MWQRSQSSRGEVRRPPLYPASASWGEPVPEYHCDETELCESVSGADPLVGRGGWRASTVYVMALSGDRIEITGGILVLLGISGAATPGAGSKSGGIHDQRNSAAAPLGGGPGPAAPPPPQFRPRLRSPRGARAGPPCTSCPSARAARAGGPRVLGLSRHRYLQRYCRSGHTSPLVWNESTAMPST